MFFERPPNVNGFSFIACFCKSTLCKKKQVKFIILSRERRHLEVHGRLMLWLGHYSYQEMDIHVSVWWGYKYIGLCESVYANLQHPNTRN